MATLTGQSCRYLVAQALLVDFNLCAEGTPEYYDCCGKFDPLKSRRGLRVIGLDASICIIELVVFCIASTVFELRTLHHLCALM
jgi:hypothetical protein